MGGNIKLGGHLGKNDTSFSVYSENASSVNLVLFNDSGKEINSIAMAQGNDGTWSCKVKGIKAGQLYAFQADGPNDLSQGHRFNKDKYIIDPYAFHIEEIKDENNQPMLLSKVVDRTYDWQNIKKPSTPWEKTIIYELHPKGFTKLNENLPADYRGKIAGLSHPNTIKYFKELGVTSLELLPMHAHYDEKHLQSKGKSNYWGYNSIGFFAPHLPYFKNHSINELKDTIKELHKNGIEVLLDVVYNHTAEGDHTGPELSMKLIDNKTYYRLNASDPSQYINETGCGNTLNVSHPAVRKMVIDSLRYWAEEFQIDGFRFDLATSIGRNPDYFDQFSPLFKDIKSDPILSKVKLIAEPWDLGPDGYKLGAFPKEWKEWNDKYRDEVRQYWNGFIGSSGKLAHRISGSKTEFSHANKSPLSSINFISAHDGFTLNDLVSYNLKHNESNQENNNDGHNSNYSCNHGHEGKTTDQRILDIRNKQKRNFLATLFLSHGTPMLLSGDEIGNTQNGNNNAYCQDNEIGWVNWKDKDDSLLEFTKSIIHLRNDHPILSSPEHLHGTYKDKHGIKDITWYADDGAAPTWNPHDDAFAVIFNNAALPDTKNKSRLMTIFNSSNHTVDFKLPALDGSTNWQLEVDTSQALTNKKTLNYKDHQKYKVQPKSLVILTQKLTS